MRLQILTILVLLVQSSVLAAGEIEFPSIAENGTLSWQGAMPGTTCRVEWASQRNGADTQWTTLGTVLVTNTQPTTTGLPTYYRVLGVPAAGIDQGLVAHYEFRSDTLDSSAYGNHATPIGTLPYVAAGADSGVHIHNPFGGNPATNFVVVPFSPSIQALETTSMTLCIRYSSLDGAPGHYNGRLLGTGDIWSEPGIWLDYNASDPLRADAHCVLKSSKSPTTLYFLGNQNSPLAVTTGGALHWQILVVDRAANQALAYVDTNLIATMSFAADFGRVALSNIVIGAASTVPYGYGATSYSARSTTVDDFRLYNRALTTAEIAALNALP